MSRTAQRSTAAYLAQTASRSASSPCAPRHCRLRLPRRQCKSSLPPRRAPGCNGCRMPGRVNSGQHTPSKTPSGIIVSHGCTHVKPSLQLTVSPQLHKHHLVQRQADQIERLIDRVGGGAGFFGRSHSASFSLRRASVCGMLFCWLVVIEMHGSADVLARLSTNSLSDVGAYSNCERLEFRFCSVPASGSLRAATSGQCKSNGYGNINGTAQIPTHPSH